MREEANITLFVFVLCGLFLIIFYGRLDVVSIDKAVFIVSVLLVVSFAGFMVELEIKHKSSKVISNPIHSTISYKSIRRKGDWAVIKLGGTDFIFTTEGGSEGTLVVPLTSLNQYGDSFGCNVDVKKVAVNQMPPEVYTDRDYMNLKPPYYLGSLTAASEAEKPTVEEMKARMEKQNQIMNMQSDLLDEKYDGYEKFQDAISRISERKQSFWDKVKGQFKEKAKEEEE